MPLASKAQSGVRVKRWGLYWFVEIPTEDLRCKVFLCRMILQFLIPCRLLRGTLPSKRLLSRFPRLTALFSPFVTAIRKGDVQSYDATLGAPAIERALVQNGIYLAVERAREICLRGLLKRVYRCKDKSSRIAIEDFHTALRFVGVQIELLETEWLVATQIAKVRCGDGSQDRRFDLLLQGCTMLMSLLTGIPLLPCIRHSLGLSSWLYLPWAHDDGLVRA